MDTLRVIVAAILAAVALGALLQLSWAYLAIPSLADVPAARGPQPSVSVIVAARDEQRHIEVAARSLLAQTYERLELIVVDDRSVDATPEILARLARADSKLRVLRVDRLPDGWLGKNHALHTGAAGVTGELLLFADADVVLAPDALSRAVRLLQLEHADHLAVAPDLVLPTWSLAL